MDHFRRGSGVRRRRRGWTIESLESRALLAADLLISEFMANNTRSSADEDGDFGDWIEIHNRGTEDADLSGWHLTDEAGELNKWSFPAQTLAAGNFLLVHASGKDRTTPDQPLHANFSLADDGEFLALTRTSPLPGDPGHIEIVSQFAPSFPQQVADVSYGIGQNVAIETVLPAGSLSRVYFPQNDSLGSTWTQLNFTDGTWTPSTNALGYESSVPGFTVQDAK